MLELQKGVRHARHSRRGAGTGQRDRGAAEPVAADPRRAYMGADHKD